MAPATTTLSVAVGDDGDYVLRVQAELLRGGRYDIVQRTTASLPFPVQGLTARAMQSLFGAERDAGIRAHEGVDIFAPRGTPVVAVTAAWRSQAQQPGGTVVWLHDARRRRTYYYAHLDRTAFARSSLVETGAVLGYVGNSGNARTTSPHLHFGIYSGGAIDPQPFIAADQPSPPPPPWICRFGTLGARTQEAWLRGGAAADVLSVLSLTRATSLTALASAAQMPARPAADGTAGRICRGKRWSRPTPP